MSRSARRCPAESRCSTSWNAPVRCLTAWAADPTDGTGLMVTHNFVVKMLVVHALAMPHHAWRRIDTGLAGLTTFRIADGAPALVGLNDRHHLDAL